MAPRCRIEDGIAQSALHLLRTGGPRAVTVEAVAGHSGIAKTTIYRRHLNRRDMLTAALAAVGSHPQPNPHATAADRLRWLIEHAVETVDNGIGLGGLAAMLTDADPESAEFAEHMEYTTAFRQLMVRQRAAMTAVIDEARADGSMRADVDTAKLIDAIVGAYIAERARTGQVENSWRDRMFDLFWPAVTVAGGQSHQCRC